MKIFTADYVKSAPSLKDCPDFGGRPEIALVGRSNVGKSSFINSLLQRKNLARTSNTPGKTRYLNFYTVNAGKNTTSPRKDLIFVDLPGYGYAKVSKTEQELWRKNFEHYLANRDTLRLVIQLIDGRHGAQDSDIRMFEWLQYRGLRVLVVMTKADKVSRNELANNTAKTAKALDTDAQRILGYSAETHEFRDAAWQIVMGSLDPVVLPEMASAPEE